MTDPETHGQKVARLVKNYCDRREYYRSAEAAWAGGTVYDGGRAEACRLAMLRAQQELADAIDGKDGGK